MKRRMPFYVEISALLLMLVAGTLVMPSAASARELPVLVRRGALALALVLGGAAGAALALRGFASAPEWTLPALALASVGYALWLLTVWAPEDGGDDEEPADEDPPPEDHPLPWGDFDRERDAWEPVPA